MVHLMWLLFPHLLSPLGLDSNPLPFYLGMIGDGWKPTSLTSVFSVRKSVCVVPSGAKNGCPYTKEGLAIEIDANFRK